MEDKQQKKPSSNSVSKVDIDALRELCRLMGDNDLVEVEYACGDLEIRLSKRVSVAAAPSVAAIQAVAPAVAAAPAAPTAAPSSAPAADDKRYLEVVSPMVGTFYSASSPDTPPFAAVGASVTDDSVVCLIEAMKVFNEIKAGVSGKIAKVCIKNEDPVEFGQVLFLVDPS